MSAKHHVGKHWHEERGERYGNQRKQVAELKVRRRREMRAKHRHDLLRAIDE